MSVETRLDEMLDRLKEHISDSVKIVAEIICDEPWGYDDLSDETKNKLENLLAELSSIKRKL